MHAVLSQSPSIIHKYRVTLPNKKCIDFGPVNVEDYTTHQDPRLMRAYLIGKGANIPDELRDETDCVKIHRGMLFADESSEEDWGDLFSQEYWNRWILWSYPTVNQAKLWLTMRHDIRFMPTVDDFYYMD